VGIQAGSIQLLFRASSSLRPKRYFENLAAFDIECRVSASRSRRCIPLVERSRVLP